MRWKGYRQSQNVDDRRGSGGGKLAVGGGIGIVIAIIIGLLSGQDFSSILGNIVSNSSEMTSSSSSSNTVVQRADEMDVFVKTILASTEDEWQVVFQNQFGKKYREPGLVLFTNSVQSACGGASSAMGPFYCPADEKVYIDLSFCDQLKREFKVPGEFAVAYVIAHEVGHHIQNLLGISNQVQSQRGRLSEAEYNKLSVKLELQADFLAGVWAHYSNKRNKWLDPADIESALTAANAIGDDKLQQQAQGYVVPESFTHGTSQQRMYWFEKGFRTGDLSQGNFNDIR